MLKFGAWNSNIVCITLPQKRCDLCLKPYISSFLCMCSGVCKNEGFFVLYVIFWLLCLSSVAGEYVCLEHASLQINFKLTFECISVNLN
uniref:Uncharacterized protein n=1 Tax=Arundo donax TaxID=35708 RepID=A0A0A9H4C0_ARUDO